MAPPPVGVYALQWHRNLTLFGLEEGEREGWLKRLFCPIFPFDHDTEAIRFAKPFLLVIRWTLKKDKRGFDQNFTHANLLFTFRYLLLVSLCSTPRRRRRCSCRRRRSASTPRRRGRPGCTWCGCTRLSPAVKFLKSFDFFSSTGFFFLSSLFFLVRFFPQSKLIFFEPIFFLNWKKIE